ncbi:thiamine pyrophosphate-dependent enzyme [Streptomyces sp. NPDC005181]|uniref:thiamine pyrophosphate-dependent enzyme n=1 Tax=Streptomyces sp. NPDC005181 TaxID=3156869 RepID=UPI0033A6C9E0
MQYTTSALWSAVRYQVPVTFVVCNNTKYRALQEFSEILHVPEGDYLDIAGIDVLDIARGYGLEVHRAESLQEGPHQALIDLDVVHGSSPLPLCCRPSSRSAGDRPDVPYGVAEWPTC